MNLVGLCVLIFVWQTFSQSSTSVESNCYMMMKAVQVKSPGDPEQMYCELHQANLLQVHWGTRETKYSFTKSHFGESESCWSKQGRHLATSRHVPFSSRRIFCDWLGNVCRKGFLLTKSSGIVEEVGSEVTQWKKGDRVMALLGGGGYAQCVSFGIACSQEQMPWSLNPMRLLYLKISALRRLLAFLKPF